MMKRFLWSPSEDERLRELKAQGKTHRQIGLILRREEVSVKHRWERLNETPEAKQARLQYNKDRRIKMRAKERAERLAGPHYRIPPPDEARAPDHVLAERNERLSRAPTSICEVLLGDPHPMRSALGRGAA